MGEKRGAEATHRLKLKQRDRHTRTLQTHFSTQLSTSSTWIFIMRAVVKCVASGLVTGSCEVHTHTEMGPSRFLT